MPGSVIVSRVIYRLSLTKSRLEVELEAAQTYFLLKQAPVNPWQIRLSCLLALVRIRYTEKKNLPKKKYCVGKAAQTPRLQRLSRRIVSEELCNYLHLAQKLAFRGGQSGAAIFPPTLGGRLDTYNLIVYAYFGVRCCTGNVQGRCGLDLTIRKAGRPGWAELGPAKSISQLQPELRVCFTHGGTSGVSLSTTHCQPCDLRPRPIGIWFPSKLPSPFLPGQHLEVCAPSKTENTPDNIDNTVIVSCLNSRITFTFIVWFWCEQSIPVLAHPRCLSEAVAAWCNVSPERPAVELCQATTAKLEAGLSAGLKRLGEFHVAATGDQALLTICGISLSWWMEPAGLCTVYFYGNFLGGGLEGAKGHSFGSILHTWTSIPGHGRVISLLKRVTWMCQAPRESGQLGILKLSGLPDTGTNGKICWRLGDQLELRY
ncbi:hypothetical protein RRG08_030154 [Elysia crispata]|uniref:Uncharacterized protein n=1 Tax=Elysia crispata TaxID=231223 RepID=A0AAE0ZT36_9GAST|nr:hypothetical protein RRG08_030154 [Elysia crispata]